VNSLRKIALAHRKLSGVQENLLLRWRRQRILAGGETTGILTLKLFQP
jgi:hypothetical protein